MILDNEGQRTLLLSCLQTGTFTATGIVQDEMFVLKQAIRKAFIGVIKTPEEKKDGEVKLSSTGK